jgi:hypothetical protein
VAGFRNDGATVTVNGGAYNSDAFSGPFFHRSNLASRNLIDGLSNTLMFGEGLFEKNVTSTSPPRAAIWMGMGPALLGGTGALDNRGNYTAFSSRHGGIVQFSLCDGSVRKLKTTITRDIYFSLGGIRDGQTVTVQ